MKVGIYNPYLDTLGGHERYCFDIASCLSREHDVDIFWDDPEILDKAQARFNIPLEGITLVRNIWISGSVFSKAYRTRRYDAIFFVSDGSIPLVFSKRAFLLFEFPVPWVKGKDVVTQLKLRRVTRIICNSSFVKHHIDATFGVNSKVITPGVDIASFAPSKKENLILSVGRFTTGMNTKKQDVLITAFKKLCDRGLKTWKLVLAGGMLPDDFEFVTKLKRTARTYPIEILPNVSFKELQALYAGAKLYWHAAGSGEDLQKHPQRAEHFGISSVEAMSAGAVPVVFAGGGQKDIVGHWVNGFLWKTEAELIAFTQSLIGDTKTWSRISKAAGVRAKDFSRERFCSQVKDLL